MFSPRYVWRVLPSVGGVLCVRYHLHWVCEHHTVEANEVLVIQRVHGVDLTDEILHSVGLAEHVWLQTFDGDVYLQSGTLIWLRPTNILRRGYCHGGSKRSRHHLPRRGQPLSSLDNAKRAVPELFQESQVLLRDEAGQSLPLAIEGGSVLAGMRGQEPLRRARGRCGRPLTVGGGGLALLGEVCPIWTLTAEHLERN